jgi:hypothetical protein
VSFSTKTKRYIIVPNVITARSLKYPINHIDTVERIIKLIR